MGYILKTINNSEVNIEVNDISEILPCGHNTQMTLKNGTVFIVSGKYRFYVDSVNHLNLIKIEEPEKPSNYIQDDKLFNNLSFFRKYIFSPHKCLICERKETIKTNPLCKECRYLIEECASCKHEPEKDTYSGCKVCHLNKSI